jgi:hypothetical protein
MGGRGGRLDGNHKQIVEALVKAGASVKSLADVGKGVPDLLVAFAGVNYLLEVKNPKTAYGRKGLNPLQVDWSASWQGAKPIVVHSPDEALEAIGIKAVPIRRTAGNTAQMK